MAARNLDYALSLGADGVVIICGGCIRRRHFKPDEALKRFGADATMMAIAQRCRCSCGAKASRAHPAWPRRSRGGSSPQMIVPKAWGRLP